MRYRRFWFFLGYLVVATAAFGLGRSWRDEAGHGVCPGNGNPPLESSAEARRPVFAGSGEEVAKPPPQPGRSRARSGPESPDPAHFPAPNPLPSASEPAAEDEETSLGAWRERALHGASPEVRRVALGRLGMESRDTLASASQDPSPEVRKKAVERMKDIEIQQQEEAEALEVAEPMNDPFLGDVLRALQDETDESVIGEAADYLARKPGSPDARQAMQQLLNRPGLSAETLGYIGEVLVEQFHEDKAAVVATVSASPSSQTLTDYGRTLLDRELAGIHVPESMVSEGE